MAQTIKLRRSSTEGKVPTTAQLSLGELAINTYDGRIFFEKNDGSATIEHIVTTDSITTGSITITGTTQTGTLTTTNRIDKQYLDDEVLNTSLNAATGSYLTSTGSVDYSDLTSVPAGILSSSAITITTAAQPNITSLGTLTTLTVDDITLNGSTISDSGDLTLDIGGDLNIDVDGTDIILKDGGTAFGRFKRDSSDFIIKSEANNEDIILRGQDGGATIDALTLDMSEAGAATFGGGIADAGTISAGTWNGSVIDKTYLDDEVLNTSLNSATGSYLTAHPNISAGSNISQNNSNGTVLQDLTITLDSNGHVTTATAGTINLDGRYYTETESDTLFTKKLGQGIISGAAQLNSTEINTLDVAGTLTAVGAFAADDSVTLSGLATQGSETDVLTINGSNVVGTRQLGSNAFNSTSFGTGSVTNVTVGTGLDVSTATTVPNITLDLSELTDMTAAVVGTQDELILLDNGAERRKLISEITLSDFNNDSGFLTSVDISSDTNLAVSDTSEVNMILSGDTLSAELIGGVVSGSSQVLGILTSLNSATSSYATGDNFDEDGTFSSLRAQGTTKGDVGLGNVTNESKSTMFTSPTFTGTPISTTPSANDNSTKIATTAYVQTELTDLVGNAPAAFDTLGEISASLAADSGALDSLTTVVSGKLQKDQNLSDLTNVGTARSNLGVDAAGTDNSTDVTLAGSRNYITISGQTITRNVVDISDDTNLAVSDTDNVDMILSGDTLSANLKGGVISGSAQLANSAISNESLNAATSSYLTSHPSISQGSNISQNNSNGTVLQDLTITLDSNGHVTTATAGTVNLDGRYYTETEIDNFGYGTGSVTNVTVGTGLDISTGTTTPAISLDLTEITLGAGLDSTATGLSLDLSELTDMTADVVGSQDELILLDNGSERKKMINEIKLSQFNNDSGFVTTTGSNADTVDNLHASSFIRSDANDTATGNITFEGTVDVDSQFNAGANIVPQTDNVGEVGTAALTFNNGRFTNFTVDSTLNVRGAIDLADDDEIRLGSGDDFIIEDNGTDTLFKSTRHGGEVYFQNENASGTNQNTLILGTDASNTDRTYVELRYNNVERIRTTVDGSRLAGIVNFDGTTQSTAKTNGTVIIDGGVGIAKTLNVGEDVVAYASSDERYKDLITPIENPNEKIKLLSGNTFVWNDKHEVFKGKKDIGVIAQEVEKVLPEIVETRDNGYKAVKYEKIVALLIESNKELIKRVEELESKIK